MIDVWKNAEEQFQDPRLAERFSEEQIQQMKDQHQKILQQKYPRGMCYVGVECECSKDFSLQFYSREYLSSLPEAHEGKAVFPDTAKIPAELFLYLEKIPEWEEKINL